MVSDPAIDRAAARVTRVCGAHDDARSLRLAVLDEIRHVVGFDAYAWLLTDPATEVGASPLADVPGPWLDELPRQIRLKYLTAVNRWTLLDDPPAAALRAVTADRPELSMLWRELLASHEVNDAASVVFRDRFGCWGFLDLWQTGGGQFRGEDIEYLSAIAGPVTTALRRCQARTFDMATAVSEHAGPVVMLLSPELQVLTQTPDTEEFLRLLVPPDTDRRPIPAGAYNVAAQLLAAEAGVDGHTPSARVHLSGGVWLTLRAARIGDHDIAVTIERTPSAERLDLYIRANGLTAREAELLTHLTTGASTRDVAHRMFVSEHTVQDHLKTIFAKTTAPNRRALIARAVGH